MKKQVILWGLVILSLLSACGPSVDMESSQTSREQTTEVQQGYFFEYNDFIFAVNEEVSDLLVLLGEPQAFLENPSCALGDLARIYTFADFQLTTYLKGEKEYLQSLVLKTDLVETAEGVCLGDTEEKVRQVYGEPSENSGNLWIYQSGNGKLQILVKEGSVESIEYSTAYLNE